MVSFLFIAIVQILLNVHPQTQQTQTYMACHC